MTNITSSNRASSWPGNLINAVLQEQNHGEIIDKWPDGLEHIMLYLAYQENPEHARQMEAVYRTKASMESVGKQYGVTATAIKMHITRLLRHLRNPQFETLYRDGCVAWCKEQSSALHDLAIKQAYNEGYAAGVADQPPKTFENTPLDKLPVDALALSARAYNALSRFGQVRTVGQLLGMTYDDLMKLRNLGRGSADEIAAALAARGLSLKKGTAT